METTPNSKKATRKKTLSFQVDEKLEKELLDTAWRKKKDPIKSIARILSGWRIQGSNTCQQ